MRLKSLKKTWTESGLFKNYHATEPKQYKNKKKYVKDNWKQPQGASLFKLSFSPPTKSSGNPQNGTLAGKKDDFFRFALFNVALFFQSYLACLSKQKAIFLSPTTEQRIAKLNIARRRI